MQVMYERVAAIDVGKKIIAVAVRTPGERVGSAASRSASSTRSIRR
jgi:hypothetical protein